VKAEEKSWEEAVKKRENVGPEKSSKGDDAVGLREGDTNAQSPQKDTAGGTDC